MYKKRHISDKLSLYLKIFPVVFLTGARQCGKTTLAKNFAAINNFHYLTLDDTSILYAAKEDPTGFLNRLPQPVVIDEVQRVPELFLPIKKLVDEQKKIGQFLLTGSANPLLIPKIGDSLAGRMGILQVFPFSQGELEGHKETFLSWVFSSNLKTKVILKESFKDLAKRVFRGGFPRVCNFSSELEIETWIEGYLQTMMDRDIRDLAQIEGLHNFPHLFKLLATRSGSLFNGADLARTLKLSTASVHRYLVLLETLFFVFREEAWFSNLGKRLAKSPKIYVCDTGILSYLLKANVETFQNQPSLFGFVIESFVVAELLKQASWAEEKIEQYHFREGTKEVDVVLEERGGAIVGIEIKSGETVRPDDFDGLKRLKEISKNKFLRGIVLYAGSSIIPFGQDLFAVPISSLWNKD